MSGTGGGREKKKEEAPQQALARLESALRSGDLAAVHVDHGLRTESGADAAFVADLCRGWDVPLRVERVEVARRPGEGWEGT